MFWSGDDNLIFVCHEIGMAGTITQLVQTFAMAVALVLTSGLPSSYGSWLET